MRIYSGTVLPSGFCTRTLSRPGNRCSACV